MYLDRRILAFDNHIICVFAHYLNGYFWAIGEWNKKMMN